MSDEVTLSAYITAAMLEMDMSASVSIDSFQYTQRVLKERDKALGGVAASLA